ncbi:hypothetical protein Hs20B_11350 [Lactococcus insecticola]|uniref:Uncharacterized protein n=1 Tax=Pseudolactococcus insecticola TaxID=2709158 RepID=A0A6A0BA84_9LACT|nr:hypothetical protein Hs20B_11350 [Lactococcus insecticola]
MRFPKGFSGKGVVNHELNDYIAIYIDPKTGEKIKTKSVKAAFRKTGSHLTPKDLREDRR